MFRIAGTVFLVALSVCGPASAVSVKTWTLSAAEEFGGGRFAGTALDEEGRVRLAPTVDRLWGPEDGIVWDVEPDGSGGAFVALSSPGRVLRVGGGRSPEVWFTSGDESLAAAIEPDGEGGVYIGLSPGGVLLHARSPEQVEELATTDSAFIWAMERADDGALWLGTGIPGRLMRYDTVEGLREVFHTADDPVRCLIVLDSGAVVMGTGGRGQVLRIDESGRPLVLLDADETEIVSIAPGDEGSFFVLAARASKQISAARAAAQSASETVRVVAEAPPSNDPEPSNGPSEDKPKRPSPAARRFKTPPGGVLYHLRSDGDFQRIWYSTTEVPFELVRLDTGKLLLGTGDVGRIYSLDERGRSSVLLDVPSDQASALALDADGNVLIGATTDARVGRVKTDSRNPGSYLSPTLDAGTVADWGRLTWDADVPPGAEILVSVRSGNTAEPDTTWSDWLPLGGAASGGEQSGASPSRWLQVMVDLQPSRKGVGPSLRRLELFYVPHNRRPTIEKLEVQPAGVVWSTSTAPSARPVGPLVTEDSFVRRTVRTFRPNAPNPTVRKTYEAGARTISWKAVDPDGDTLTYRLDIRRDHETQWTPLALDLTDAFYGWDARAMPDGLYRVRLTVDDASDNVEDHQYEDERVGAAFRIDNTRPAVADYRVRREASGYEVAFVATDEGGSVASVEVAIDAGAWRSVEPVDGVADSGEERYEVVVDSIPEGEAETRRRIMVRVTDTAGNLGGESWTLDVD